jgi:Flp pilus assembly protein TadG
MARRTLRKRSKRGATILETAIVLTAFIVLTFGVFEYGRILMLRQLLQNAAREGARQATVGVGTKTTSDIQTIVMNSLAGAPLSNVNIQVYAADANGSNIGPWNDLTFGTGTAVQVNADGVGAVPTLGLIPSVLHFQVKSVMACEAN